MNPQGDNSYFISLTGNKGSYIHSTNIYRASALHQAFNKAGYCGGSSGRRGILREYSQEGPVFEEVTSHLKREG